jgi:hypothetical protein
MMGGQIQDTPQPRGSQHPFKHLQAMRRLLDFNILITNTL